MEILHKEKCSRKVSHTISEISSDESSLIDLKKIPSHMPCLLKGTGTAQHPPFRSGYGGVWIGWPESSKQAVGKRTRTIWSPPLGPLETGSQVFPSVHWAPLGAWRKALTAPSLHPTTASVSLYYTVVRPSQTLHLSLVLNPLILDFVIHFLPRVVKTIKPRNCTVYM